MDHQFRAGKSEPVQYRIFAFNNWAGFGRFRVQITYANGYSRQLLEEFQDEAGALRYMARFHGGLPIQRPGTTGGPED